MTQRITRSTFLFLVTCLGACGVPAGSAGVADVAGSSVSPSSSPQASPSTAQGGSLLHRRCGWIFTNEPTAAAAFTANARFFDAIHPDWYALGSDGVGLRPLADVDDPVFLEAAAGAHVAVIPLVASVENPDWTRSMMRDAGRRTRHIAALVDLARTHHYAGLDLDYEQMWDPSDKAPIATFVTEYGAAMHAAGLVATMAFPALDGPSSTWSYDVAVAALDHVHVMGYDFHTTSNHAGPTAPLGWVDAVGAYAAATGHADRFILGLPNYGINASSFCVLGACASSCTGPIAESTHEMESCPLNTNHYGAGRILSCPSASGTLYFDDTASLGEKAASARAHGMGGIGYWNVGGEPAGFFDGMRKYD